jgi:hypothetical protein
MAQITMPLSGTKARPCLRSSVTSEIGRPGFGRRLLSWRTWAEMLKSTGEADLIAEHDWAATPLGVIESCHRASRPSWTGSRDAAGL